VTARGLAYVPRSEFDRVMGLDAPPAARARIFAALARINALYMIKVARSGHPGTTFSSLDIVTWLHLFGMRRRAGGAFQDVYFSSKGHDVPGLYSILLGLGILDWDLLHRLRKLDGLPGHPDVRTPGVSANSGSLGMGVSKAKGMILADRLRGRDRRVYVLTGDGELQEGQFWEALQPAANRKLRELVVIVDRNRIQSDTWVEKVSPPGDLEGKLRAFGWTVDRIDGHDMESIERGLAWRETEGPRIVIADTVKGKGISVMEKFGPDEIQYRYHSGAPSDDDYVLGLEELARQAERPLGRLGAGPLALERSPLPPPPDRAPPQKLVPAYGRALVREAERDPRIVVLDADLVTDTGIRPFAEKFPHRFFECGIAEQDMVSQAGGMALSGLLPVVHSFACFLSTRPNEQIYTNATERTRILYVGSLAGLVPSGPGHSHQSVRDISILAAIPGMVLAEPATERETELITEHLLRRPTGSAYLRLVSLPCQVPFELPEGYRPVEGRGLAVTEGRDAVLFGYGPVLLSEAFAAARLLAGDGIGLRVVDLPWLNRIDREWLAGEIEGARRVFTLDNHYVAGGQGQMVAAEIARIAPKGLEGVTLIGVEEIPRCGRNDEALRAHGLDAESLRRRIREALDS
jgi:transketolase